MKWITLLLAITLFAPAPAQAQLGRLQRKLEKKLADKLTKKAEDKAEQKVEEKLDEVGAEKGEESTPSGRKKSRTGGFDLGKLMGGEGNVETEEAYAYDFRVDWKVISEDSEGPREMSQLYTERQQYMGMEYVHVDDEGYEQLFHSVLDFERNFFLVLTPDEGRGMVFEFENIEDQVAAEKEAEPEVVPSFTRTNERRTIAGYSCVKYLYTAGSGSGEMWVTTELDYLNFDMFSYFKQLQQKQKGGGVSLWTGEIEGFMLAIKGVDEEGKAFEMEAVHVDPDANEAQVMEEYQLMDLRGLSKGLGGFSND